MGTCASDDCPVARAMLREGLEGASVDECEIHWMTSQGFLRTIETPADVAAFVTAFDGSILDAEPHRDAVVPFSFELEVE